MRFRLVYEARNRTGAELRAITVETGACHCTEGSAAVVADVRPILPRCFPLPPFAFTVDHVKRIPRSAAISSRSSFSVSLKNVRCPGQLVVLQLLSKPVWDLLGSGTTAKAAEIIRDAAKRADEARCSERGGARARQGRRCHVPPPHERNQAGRQRRRTGL